MSKTKNRQKHHSGNPLKRIQQNKLAEQKKVKKPFPWKPVLISILAVVILAIAINIIYSYVKDKNEVLAGSYIDEKKNVAVVTYPAGIFGSQENMEATADVLKETDGIKKVIENADGSLSVKMTIEQYEKVKSAVDISTGSMMLSAVSDSTGISDIIPNEDYSVIDVVVNKSSFNGQTELSNCNLMARTYQVCNKMDYEATVTFNYIDQESGEKFRSETFDVHGNMISSEGEEISSITESATI